VNLAILSSLIERLTGGERVKLAKGVRLESTVVLAPHIQWEPGGFDVIFNEGFPILIREMVPLPSKRVFVRKVEIRGKQGVAHVSSGEKLAFKVPGRVPIHRSHTSSGGADSR
jgi:hypothetical protein